MNYPTITSRSNAKIRELLTIKQRKTGLRKSFFLVEGPHLISMALASGVHLREAFFTSLFSRKQEGQGILKALSAHAVKTFEVADQVFHALTDTETPQGIIAVVFRRQITLEKLPLGDNPLLLIADRIQDPGNLGTLIRTADAAGADAVVILPGTCDVYMQKAIRATAGSLFNIPVVHALSDELLPWITSHGIRLAVTSAEARTTLFDVELNKPLAFVFGNEAQGVQEALRIAADVVLSVPILGKAESLNVSTSAAVCLYEAIRQRTRKK
jgi:RNA methyltransferase, TrmH family